MASIKLRGHRVFVGIAGEYLVAAELSRRNIIATLTAKNTPEFDALATSADGRRSVNLQIKTTEKNTGGILLGNHPLIVMGDKFFFVFVYLPISGIPRYWIIPQKTVATLAEKSWQDWVAENPQQRSTAPRTFRWKWIEEQFSSNENGWGVLKLD